MSKGFFNKVLWIDLSNETIEDKEISDEIIRQYIGGYGLAAKLIYDNMPAKANPLGPEAILGFFPGLLTSTVAPLSGRFMVAGKSPLTGGWGDANCGGYFGPEIKKCGYDGVLVKGKASSPKLVTVIDGQKQIVDASDVWGLDVVEFEDKIKEKYGRVQTAAIGQSGEKLSLISCIVNDKARVAGRSGLGAVMGSKNLKALVFKGSEKIDLADRDTLVKITQEYNDAVKNAPSDNIQTFKSLGTTGLNTVAAMQNDTPIKNWGGAWQTDFPNDKLNKLSGQEILKYKQKAYGCFSCPVQCGAIMKVPEVGIEETHRPEYETCASFGHLCLNDDLMSIFTVNDLCNRGGIDTISTGSVVAFAIECYENGILTKDDTGGLELNWGNSSAIIELTKKIINREGIGDILANGSKIASEKIGKGSEKFAIHSMGQELGMHNPKVIKYLGVSYLFDPTPGRHTTANLDMYGPGLEGKPDGIFQGFTLPEGYKIPSEDRSLAGKMVTGVFQFTNSVGLCEFIYFFRKYPLTELVNAATGWGITMEEIIKTGIRIQSLRQAFNIREGIDILKNIMSERAVGMDYLEGYRGVMEQMGWNPENGYPLKETLKKLNLDFVIKDLY